MGKYLKAFWKFITWTRIALLNLIFLLFVVVIISAIVSAPKKEMPENTALFVAPAGFIVDQLTYNPSAIDLIGGQNQPKETKLKDLVDGITQAASDKRVTSIVLKLDYLLGGGMSKLEEIGQALEKFKASGKRVYAYGDNFSQQQYFLASYADEVYLNDLGTVLLTGFGMYQNYFKDAADKLNLDFHVFRVGNYKDAVEPFVRNNMSQASREHNGRWINSLWQRYSSRLEKHRKLAPGAIDTYIKNWGVKPESPISNSQMALDAGLVDKVVSRVELLNKLQRLFGEGEAAGTFDALHINDYLSLTRPPIELPDPDQKTIGVVVADGNIFSGEQPDGSIGSDTFSRIIQNARDDNTLKALVIRVNSGGGSAFASEVIRQELKKTKDLGIPVYISMGSVAASGGYWVAAGASQIWATPSTLTGSIGVFALYPNASRTLNKLGIHTDGISTSPLAASFNPGMPLTQEAGVAIQRGVDNIYQTFLRIVAEARDSDTEAVHLIAQGRVWTGEDAKELGLIDRLGSLNDTIEAIAADHNIVGYKVKEYARPLSTEERILRSLMEQASFDLGSVLQIDSRVSELLNLVGKSNAARTLEEALKPDPSGMNIFANCLECVAP